MMPERALYFLPVERSPKTPGPRLGAVEVLAAFDDRRIGMPTEVVRRLLMTNNSGQLAPEGVEQLKHELGESGRIVLIGGDHSCTATVCQSLGIDETWGMIVFDAHNDSAGLPKTELRNWNFLDHVVDSVGQLVVLGTRYCVQSMPRVERAIYFSDLDFVSVENVLTKVAVQVKSFSRLYISIDLDVLNPIEFPGVGHAVSGGIWLRELLFLIDNLLAIGVPTVLDILEFNSIVEREKSIRVISRILNHLYSESGP